MVDFSAPVEEDTGRVVGMITAAAGCGGCGDWSAWRA